MDLTRLNPDNRIIGENIAAAIKKANPENKRAGVTARSVAKAVAMHHVALSHVMTGQRGLSEERLIKVAGAIGVHPATLIEGISARAREDRYAHIPAATNRNKRDRATKGMAVASVEALVKNPHILSAFFGGITPEDQQEFIDRLLDLRARAAALRLQSTGDEQSSTPSTPSTLSTDETAFTFRSPIRVGNPAIPIGANG